MLYGGHRRADIPESEYKFYQLIMTRLDYAMDEHKDNADIMRVLDYVRYGARHGTTERHAMGNTRRLLDIVEREEKGVVLKRC